MTHELPVGVVEPRDHATHGHTRRDTTTRQGKPTKLRAMASRTCWSCNTHAHQTLMGVPKRSSKDVWWAGFRCDHCGAWSVAKWLNTFGAPDSNISAIISQSSAHEWHPHRMIGKEFPDVPEHIASAADEAHRSLSIGAHRATILLGRSVVEATAKDKGITKGTLAVKIDELHAQGHVRELIATTAHEIRHLGNDMAHGDFVDPVTAEQAEDVMAFMDEVLNEVYQAPARVNARRDARLAATHP